jgi:hypothetical protein
MEGSQEPIKPETTEEEEDSKIFDKGQELR